MASILYVVKSGDNLSKIAGELLGDPERWSEIFEANRDKIQRADLIFPGQELTIPTPPAEAEPSELKRYLGHGPQE